MKRLLPLCLLFLCGCAAKKPSLSPVEQIHQLSSVTKSAYFTLWKEDWTIDSRIGTMTTNCQTFSLLHDARAGGYLLKCNVKAVQPAKVQKP